MRKIDYIESDDVLSFDAEYSCKKTPIDELITLLNTAKEHGATHLRFKAYTDMDGVSDSIEIYTLTEVVEADEEFTKRIAAEKKAAERKEREKATAQEEADRKEFERLKKKFAAQ